MMSATTDLKTNKYNCSTTVDYTYNLNVSQTFPTQMAPSYITESWEKRHQQHHRSRHNTTIGQSKTYPTGKHGPPFAPCCEHYTPPTINPIISGTSWEHGINTTRQGFENHTGKHQRKQSIYTTKRNNTKRQLIRSTTIDTNIQRFTQSDKE